MNRIIFFFLFLVSGYASCSKVPEALRAEYASGMFEAFVTQSYGKSTIAFYQFDVAREKAKKAGENPLRIAAIENLFAWYRMYASSLRLYHKNPTGTDRIIGEYRLGSAHNHFPKGTYESEWGNSPEQARLVREFIFGVGEVISGVYCVSVGSVLFGTVGFVGITDGATRIFTSLNSLWALHETELQALKTWEETALKPAIKQ